MAFPDSDLQVIVKAYLGADPTAAPGTWPAATDLSSRLSDAPIQSSAGRCAGQASANASSLTLTLLNDDGALTPLLATSQYYPYWDLGCPMSVEVGGVGASPPYGLIRGFIASMEQTVVPVVGGGVSSAVKVTLGGVIRQLGLGGVEKSAMRRYYDQVSPQPVSYWPLESGDRRGATEFPAAIDGVRTLKVVESTDFGVTRPFSAAGGVSPGPVGAASATDTSAGGFLVGHMDSPSNATTARAEISILADGFEDTFPFLVGLRNTTVQASDGGQIRIWAVAQNFAGTWKVGVAWTNASVDSSAYTSDAFILQDNLWHLLQLDISSAGGGANTAYVLRVDGTTILSGTATGYTWVVPDNVAANSLAVDIDRVAHLAAWAGTSLPTAADSYDAFLGHPGEAAHTRIARVCAEDGVPFSTTATVSRACGPQPVGDLLAIVRDAEAVDHGVLSELLSTWGLGYVSVDQRYNLTAALTIDLDTYRVKEGESVEVVTPVRNDARLRNQWTVSMPSGGDVTVSDPANIAKRGRYKDSAEVNVPASDALVQDAAWRVREGTYDGPRYKSLPIDLAANSASPSNLLTPWLAASLGNRIDRVNNPTPAHPNDDTTAVLLGYSQTIGRRAWKVDAVIEPYEPWRVQQLTANPPASNTLDGWAVPTTLTLHTTVNATATSWSVDITPLMATASDNFPARAYCEGELITITACSGASSPQTWTVTRSTNGVSKSHTAGAVIDLADPLVATL